MDSGRNAVDTLLLQMESDVKDLYKEAEQDLIDKVNDYWKRFSTKDKIKLAQLKAGEITQEEYYRWKTGQLLIGKRWEEQLNVISRDLLNANNIAKSIVNGYMPDVYAISHNYGTYEVESLAGLDTSYTLYDRFTVERLLRDKPELLPPIREGSRLAQQIANNKVIAWEKKQVTGLLLQGILQGEDNVKIAKRMRDITHSDWKSAVRYARTATTGVECAGRIDSYKRAEKMGIQLEQQWLATLDMRTRHSHRMLDGVSVKVGEKFPNGCKYPGDPDAPAAEIWNCRCSVVAGLKGIPELDDEGEFKDLNLRNTDHLKGMTYDEWQKGKSKSDPILKAKQIGEARKYAAIKEYKEAAQRLGV